ncbi:MAG: class I SAM-dependent methyltransferase [Bacteroidetes bacterium]|nr:class I SAM-dependent methyltransferase [Bacteroidota bacterium]
MACICRYCKNIQTEQLFETIDIFQNKWAICKCNICNAFFISPEPKQDQLKLAYDYAYYGECENKFIFSVEKFIDYFRRRKAKYIASLIPENAKVLDLGCGNGRFLRHLSTFGNYDLHGLEIEGASAERACKIKEIKLRVKSLKQNDYPDSSFDVITLFHVFEHIDNPKETLVIIKNILKKDGLLVVSFPNIAGWQAKIFKGKWYHLDPPRHLFFLDSVDFINVMEGFGFILVQKNWFSFEQNPYGWIQSCLNLMCNKREVLYERLKGNNSYAPEYRTFNIFFQKLFFIFTLPFFILLDIAESVFGKSATVRLTFRKK